MKSLREERIGMINKNNQGSLMKIGEYNNTNDVVVKFSEYGNLVHTKWDHFIKGNVKNVYDKTAFGHGFYGEGSYISNVDGYNTPQYQQWYDMIRRCYDDKFHIKNKTYADCKVSDEWLNFQNFAKWMDANYYTIDSEVMCLDKDMLIKGNKIYSKETVIFVPQTINSLIVNRKAVRGLLPCGVSLVKNKYRATCSNVISNKKIHIGYFNTIEEAFQAYKTYKERLIKQIASEYQDKIPNKLYDALMNYIVEITD